ncbi:MAG TPA: PTS sugar transporter subunit IIA [Bacillus sp. (in: firmicutes)]|uniref:PTS sugar transporter subunit IIA n=1 Tax=Bacillus litorisediminis TaxID=2922713 RepID=UPI001FAD17F3|nr:PTS sugar transporter subunit IIA [Bacillus litorisediminis]HWO78203.1 PTS sugar transporter subunit IIA [Bacillus sp. (in: firmicutes)]
MFFDRKITFFNLEVADQMEALKTMANKLYEADLVKSSFQTGILEREKAFPTGLFAIPYGIAIPHTDANKVKVPQIAFASLKNPVRFKQMGNHTNDVDVSLIFMLALKKAEDQLNMLQKLMDIFQDPKLLAEFAHCQNQQNFDELLNRIGLE